LLNQFSQFDHEGKETLKKHTVKRSV